MSRIGRALISSDDSTGAVTLPSSPSILPASQGGFGQDISNMSGVPYMRGGTVYLPVTGAKADGATDDTAALQAAIDAAEALLTDATYKGAQIHLGPGHYKTTKLTVDVAGVQLCGAGYYNTVLDRYADTSEALVDVTTAGQFTLANLRVTDAIANTNTGPLLQLSQVNDITLQNVWFYGGYRHVYADRSDGITAYGCIFEASRNHSWYQNQGGNLSLVGNYWYANGLTQGASAATDPACVKIVQAAGYAYKPGNINITGNRFNYGRYCHFIQADNTANLGITGNTFHLAGMYDGGRNDDINLTACDGATITGNTSRLIYNNYLAGNRASRYCVAIGSTCTGIVIAGNAFQAGASGTIYDPGGVAQVVGSYPAASNDVYNPAIRVPTGAHILFLDSTADPARSGYIYQDQSSGHLYFGNNNATRFGVTSGGPVWLPQMTTTERDAVATPQEGYAIVNTTTHKLEVYLNGSWTSQT